MDRIYLDPGRIIVSKPGFAASPTMAEAGKALDSDWGYTGTLVMSGYYLDPAPAYNGDATRTLSSAEHAIAIPSLFGVREYLVVCASDARPTRSVNYHDGSSWQIRDQAGVFDYDFAFFIVGNGALRRNRPRFDTNPDRYERITAGIHYQVYAV